MATSELSGWDMPGTARKYHWFRAGAMQAECGYTPRSGAARWAYRLHGDPHVEQCCSSCIRLSYGMRVWAEPPRAGAGAEGGGQ